MILAHANRSYVINIRDTRVQGWDKMSDPDDTKETSKTWGRNLAENL